MTERPRSGHPFIDAWLDGQRELLYDLHKVCRRLSNDAADWLETDLAFKTYSNLLRRWSEN